MKFPYFTSRVPVLLSLILLSTLLLSSCNLFVSPYDPLSYEHLTSLKAFHLKFIDDFTKAEGKEWNDDLMKEQCDNGDLRFREALEYEKEKKRKDKNRENAIRILHEEFSDNCKLLKDKKGFFGTGFAAELKNELEANYGYAIEGEVARMNGPE
ncbi:MAG: hypothetical protein V3V59_03590 [Thermodesulfovibrionales bacterium]